MTRALLIGTALALLTACSDKPKATYERLVFHARTGNEAAFLETFTEDSRKLVKTLLALRRTYGDLVDRDANPYLSLVLEEVEDVVVETREVPGADGIERVKREVATLTVTDGRISRRMMMIETDDGWKVDALATQRLWAEDRRAFVER